MPKFREQICFYSDAAEWGGQEILSARIANILSSAFARILFFHFSPKFRDALDPKIQTVCLPFSASTPFPIFRDRSRSKQRIVEKLFRDYHVKNLIVCPGNIERCLPAIFAAHRLKIQTVSYYPMAFTQSESGATLGKLRDILARSIYPLLSEWIVISRTQERLLRRFIARETPVHLLPNPLSWDFVCSPKIPGTPLKIATIGRIYFPQKGQDSIPIIARELRQEHFSFSFRVVGDGPDLKSLKSSIERHHVKECVSVSKWVSPDKLRQMLNEEFDLVLIPSRFEGEPLILFEAMQCGLPVLVADEEYVREYELPDWMLYRPDSPSDAATKIRNLSKSYDEETFVRTRTRLFANRGDVEFASLVLKIFGEIFSRSLR